MAHKKPAAQKARVNKKSQAKRTSEDGQSVTFHYIKCSEFKSVHIDGAIGGITPRGLVHIAFFSERSAIPQMTVSKVLPTGRVGEEIRSKRVGKDGIVRQLDIDVFMTESAALDLRNWLNARLEELAAHRQATEKRKKSN